MAKKAYNVKTRIISALRKLSRFSPMRGEAMRAAKVGYGRYKCKACGESFPPTSVKVDHVLPVVPVSGWVSWDDFIARLFCPASELQVLCQEDHDVKTQRENVVRKACRAAAKAAKNGA